MLLVPDPWMMRCKNGWSIQMSFSFSYQCRLQAPPIETMKTEVTHGNRRQIDGTTIVTALKEKQTFPKVEAKERKVTKAKAANMEKGLIQHPYPVDVLKIMTKAKCSA